MSWPTFKPTSFKAFGREWTIHPRNRRRPRRNAEWIATLIIFTAVLLYFLVTR